MIKKTTFMHDWVADLNRCTVAQAIEKLSRFNPEFTLHVARELDGLGYSASIVKRETVDAAFDILKG